ncbi:carbohydrate kinase family protein [Olivibacter sitiensis]|uniref:carbohydrate kinase family protein n=1 Tax=Olivibacter sitiensis TaxID=376470 RepID=UPI000416C789|nr:carbohydrate kinase [Olivibacter sitiensis]
MEKKVVCFGEILWDMLPSGPKAGGAPMNVAYHLRRLGIKSEMISRVGEDEMGRRLTDRLQDMGLSTEYIQIDKEHHTSEVIATIGTDNEVSYDIIAPVAWDFIEYEDRFAKLVSEADILVYGSLVARNATTRDTLYRLVDQAKMRLFDVNLRPPHYTRETLEYLLHRSEIVKLNINEMRIISGWLGNITGDEAVGVALIQQEYGIKEIVLTKGGDGASYYIQNEQHSMKAYPVTVKDTVGSGDSFLAAFLSQKLQVKPIEEMLDFASALGAYVTTQEGANPDYKATDLNRFMWEKYLEKIDWK